MNHEEFPNPNADYIRDYNLVSDHQIRLQALRRIEQELAEHLRNQTIINDIKRQCGVSTSEGK